MLFVALAERGLDSPSPQNMAKKMAGTIDSTRLPFQVAVIWREEGL
jgi:hypothetical protein